MTRPWSKDAACLDEPPELFVPHSYNDHDVVAAAVAVCARCPVAWDCLMWALDVRDDWAVLGGTTPLERRRMRRGSGGPDGQPKHDAATRARWAEERRRAYARRKEGAA